MIEWTVIKENNMAKLIHAHGQTEYKGCQCYKSECGCKDDFESRLVDSYSVARKTAKCKVTYHKNLEDAEKRFEFVTNLPKQVDRSQPQVEDIEFGDI